ncbi:MAG: hypothetical protein ABI873_07800, partial [Marmoricola sp.]
RGRRTTLRDLLSRDLLSTPGTPLFPEVDGDDVAHRWTDYVTRRGFDMQGALSTQQIAAEARPAPTSLESAVAALADAVEEVARLRAENEAMVAQNTRLDRKRRKHRKRAKDLSQQVA